MLRLPYLIGTLLLAGFVVTSFAAHPGQLVGTRMVLVIAGCAFLFVGLIGQIKEVGDGHDHDHD
jgi:hypothetical protein